MRVAPENKSVLREVSSAPLRRKELFGQKRKVAFRLRDMGWLEWKFALPIGRGPHDEDELHITDAGRKALEETGK